MKKLLPLAALACLLAACDGGGKTITPGELEQLVLQRGDLPAAFLRFDEGRQVTADLPGGARSDPQRFGRKDGWKARYRRPAGRSTRGPLIVESRADAFGSAGGATRELDAYKREFAGPAETAAGRLLQEPELGDDAFAATFRRGTPPFAVRFYLVAWRERNVTASVLAEGFERRIELADAVDLARKQEGRIAAAEE